MQVIHDGTKVTKHKVIGYADRGKFDRQRKSQAHFALSGSRYINIGYGSRLLDQHA